MNIEKVIHEGGGVVVGFETGRVVAKFSHEAEAEAYCRIANMTVEDAVNIFDDSTTIELYNSEIRCDYTQLENVFDTILNG